jgi:hypothetical protein
MGDCRGVALRDALRARQASIFSTNSGSTRIRIFAVLGRLRSKWGFVKCSAR